MINKQKIEHLARECGGMLVYDHAGAPVQVQGMDLHKFVGFVNIYLRGIAAAEVESYMEDSPDETVINLIKYGDLT